MLVDVAQLQQLYRIIPRTIYCLLTGEKLKLDGGGKSIRSFIHMDDVSDATWRIAQKGKPGESFHISTTQLVTIHDLVQKLCDKLGVDFGRAVEIGPERPGKDQAYSLGSDKIRQQLGWTDKITLDQGIAACIAWMKDNLDVIKRQPMQYIHKP